MEEELPVRFRVGAVYQNCYISVYLDEQRILHRKCRILAPGEMETVILKKEQLTAGGVPSKITVRIEQE